MKRTFNFTGRRRINRKDVTIRLRQDRKAWVFDTELRLTDYQLARNAEIWIEAYRQNLWMQWPWGTVGLPKIPPDRRLLEFDEPDGVLFRVRIVQPPGAEHHKLLGEADGIPFIKAGEAEDRRRHLLTPVPEALDHELWRIDFESEPPRLLVNKDAQPSWKEVARSPSFIALVYPEVMRQILLRATAADASEDDESEGWEADWVRFARNECGLGPAPGPQEDLQLERERWVGEAVAAFARRNELRKKWNDENGEGR